MMDKDGKRTVTFSDANEAFFKSFDDPSIFDCQDFNLIKVAQQGINIGYDFRCDLELSFMGAMLKRELSNKLKRVRSPHLKKKLSSMAEKLRGFGHRPILILDELRVIKLNDGQYASTYFSRILPCLNRDSTIYASAMHANSYAPEELKEPLDVDLSTVSIALSAVGLLHKHRTLFKALQSALQVIKGKSRFCKQEIACIARAFQIFWDQYRSMDFVLQHLSIKKALLICHYGNDGSIMALRQHGAEILELQHGLIAASDAFYVYPANLAPIRARALFPDKILTYGPYWSRTLRQGSEFHRSQIDEIGFYLETSKELTDSSKERIKKRGTHWTDYILVSGQTNLFETYNDYAIWLSDELQRTSRDHLILFKPHPNTEKGVHGSLRALPNVVVVDQLESMHALMKCCAYHISIYSTTLFEAALYPIHNYALVDPACVDYVNEVLSTGIAESLGMRENPVTKTKVLSPVESNDYFSEFDTQNLQSLLGI